jgi:cytochrome bd-type quinol oxidase subunit 2
MPFLVILGLVILVGVVYMAISKKSTFMIRVAALGALALMVITVIVCLILFFTTAGVPQYTYLPDVLPEEIPPPPSEGISIMMIMYILFMIALFVMVLILAVKEQRKTGSDKNPVAAADDGDDYTYTEDDYS